MSRAGVRQALHRLAKAYGVQASYLDASHIRRQSPDEALLAVLQALGAPLARMEDAASAFEERAEVDSNAILHRPIHVVWEGEARGVRVSLPKGSRAKDLACDLVLESREVWRLRTSSLKSVATPEGEVVAIPLPTLPVGYHALTVEIGSRQESCPIIVAPRKAFQPQDGVPQWGVFMPAYALHSAESWGAGDLGDLEALVGWTGMQGGSLVGTLPFLAAFLDEPFDPSPYSPASRLFWNELYLDVKRLPELGQCPAARAMLESAAFQEEVAALRAMPLVDYRRQMSLKRRIIEALAECLFAEPSLRREALLAYVQTHPEVEIYARFRATLEQRAEPWHHWPERPRLGAFQDGDYQEKARRYHLYAQWAMEQQLETLAETGRRAGAGLYLDLPLGVHAQAYDAWRWQDLFVRGVSLGAPPDALGPEGQEWGIAPLHPERLQGPGLAYFIACLRRNMQYARALRLDHVMGLHRQFWVPRGMKASQGVYVHYPVDALYAALTLESQRSQTMVIGEDLGTVPPEVRPRMERHGLRRMYVAQFEMQGDSSGALRPVPEGAAASLNTHDTPTFADFCQGADLDLRRQLGLLDDAAAERTKDYRRTLARALGQYLFSRGKVSNPSPDQQELIAGLLRHLGESPAAAVLVNLEDLWRETHQQNLPGTWRQHPNWRWRAAKSLEEFTHMPQVVETLSALAEARRKATCEQPGASRDGSVQVVFSLHATKARSVALAGDFNGWDPGAAPMTRQADGWWRAVVPLAPGAYQYKFLVNGEQWLEDPNNPLRLPNPFGGYNSVRDVVAGDE